MSDVGASSSSTSGGLAVSSEGSESIPWTITNRYYTAHVHFETRLLKELRSHHVDGVPAVVYVFSSVEVSDLACITVERLMSILEVQRSRCRSLKDNWIPGYRDYPSCQILSRVKLEQ